MKTIHVRIKGISPLLMHRFPLETVEAVEKKTPAEQAEISAYRIPGDDNELYIPGINIQRALVSAATFSKGKGRASLQKQAAAGMMITSEYCGLGTDEYQIDARPVVVPATKGRVVRYRPRLDAWEVSFYLEYDETLLKEVEVKRIVDDCGSRVGLLDFRPERKGSFGRFMVTSWQVENGS
jgi:hypothetical protein